MDIVVTKLNEMPKFVYEVSNLLYKQFKDVNEEFGINNPFDYYKHLREFLSEEELPVFFIAVDLKNNQLLGIGSLEKTEFNELEPYNSLHPWIGNLFVKPNYRNKKIATEIVKEICKYAKELNYNKIYAYTDLTIPKNLNFTIIGKEYYLGKNITILEKELKKSFQKK